MVKRCYNPSSSTFVDYKQRGITVCPEWLGEHGFEQFYADMGPRPEGLFDSWAYAHFLLLRINPERGYSPDNCKWGVREDIYRSRRKSSRVPLYVRAAQEADHDQH